MESLNTNEKINNMSRKKSKNVKIVDKKVNDNVDIVKNDKMSKVNNLSLDEIFRFLDLYFDRNMVLYSHLYNSFNKFFNEDIKTFLEYGDHTFFEKVTATQIIRYKFLYSNITIKPPVLENDLEPMFPSDARSRSLTYSGKLLAKVTQLQEIIDIATDEKKVREIGKAEENVPIAILPIMVRSQYCSLNLYKGYDKSECEYDPGGYFIVNGSEKVVIAQDKMCENKALVFTKKDSGVEVFNVQVNSKSYKPHGGAQIVSIRLKKDNILTLRVPILSEINVLIVLRALGIESDKDLINYIVYDENDNDMIDLLRTSLDECKNDKGIKIQTQEDALEFLTTKMRVIKKYSETDKNVKQQQKRLHLRNLLENGFLHHVASDMFQKGVYLCYMINRLLKCVLKRIPKDDRDSYVNKRIDLPGNLIDELFRQFYRKMINECNKFFKKRNQRDEDPINIINQIKPNIIEQGLKTALLTGSWIRRKGVAQMLQRLTFLQTMSFLRRIDAPGGDASTNKLTGPRHLHPSSARWQCCVTGDSEVLMEDNATVKLIKDIRDGYNVISTYPNEKFRECVSKVKNYFSSKPERILKITTISGREVKCTLDHQLMVRVGDKYEYRKAQDMKINDELIVRHYQKYLPLEKETIVILDSKDVPIQYRDDLQNIGLLDRRISQENLEITARLIGANITDGYCGVRENGKYYDCMFCVGEEDDGYDIYMDMMKLGFDGPAIKRQKKTFFDRRHGRYATHNVVRVEKNGAFAYYMKMMGTFIGKKTKMHRKLPDWLINANKRIKREFLSGMQGGDGCRVAYHINGKYHHLALGPTQQTTYPDYLESTKTYLESLMKMFAEFDIETKITYKKNGDALTDEEKNILEACQEDTDILIDDKDDISNAINTCLSFGQSYDNITKFADYIGYRYCNHKRKVSAPVIEYIKYKNYLAKIKAEKYDIIRKMYDEGIKPQQIQKKTGIEESIVKRIIINHNKGIKPKAREVTNDCIKFEDFREKYFITLGILASSIISIKEIEPEIVYDFETHNDTHNFMINGVLTKNCIQTPEHSKVGLTRHFALLGTVSMLQTSQITVIKSFLKNKLINIEDISANKLKDRTKVFLNGEWLGISDSPLELYNELRNNKLNGTFDPTTSVIHDILEREIKVYCDGGRGYAPAIVVDNNVIKLTVDHINAISLNRSDKDKITSWDQFMTTYPGIVEYVDMEEQPFRMFADKASTVEAMRVKMENSIGLVANVKDNKIENRYDDLMFARYTHCDFHPSVLIGEIATNIVFLHRNQGPRNIFYYSQGRQAMGIYVSNYRDRLDISYILYHPQRPLVMTRTSKYTYSDILPAGENCVVAIACYTGYNQEDSLIFNKSAIQRGLFRSTSLKKYITSIQKNQSTAQDDLFMKPDPTKVTGMKHGSYDKLNDKGYVPEETVIVNGDIIIGKVSPIQPTGNNNKIYKDSSEVYKSHASGVIDKVYTGTHNNEGYEMMKVRVRSMRIPTIGDKYCCYSDDTQVLTNKGWIYFKDLTLKHKVASLVGNEMKYCYPTHLQTYDFVDDKMVRFEGNGVDLLVTPNHNMYVSEDMKKFKLITAENCCDKKLYFKKDAIINGVHKEEYVMENGNKINMNNWLEFLGIFLRYGQICNDSNCLWIPVFGEKTKNRLIMVSRELGFEYVMGGSNENTLLFKLYGNNSLVTELVKIGKRLPGWIWDLDVKQLKYLYDGLDCGNKFVAQCSDFADDLQRLCLHVGHPVDIKIEMKGELRFYALESNEMEKSGVGRLEEYRGKVYCCTVDDGIIYVRRNGYGVWCGNSRHGQKGTMGLPVKASDLMFSGEGIQPDIILNPNAIPSRMTIGQLVECLLGKVSAIEGHDADGTPFNDIDIESIKDRLEKLGYNRNGVEYMYNGMTGQKMKIMIFIGPTYYHRLKHLVEDKIHSRARGPRSVLVRQPPEGRSREGGLRLGEMERDSCLAHGLARYLKEKLLDTSDAYTAHCCGICGLFAQRLYRKESKKYITSHDIFYCPACKNYTHINKIMIPYAFKLLVQEMLSLNIAARIRIKQNIYTS